MSFWIHGWVEVTTFDGADQDDDYAWMGAVNLSPLIDVADPVSEMLFGLSKRCIAREVTVESLAAGRGAPANPSKEVQRELDEIRVHELEYGPGECGGYTHAMWREIKDFMSNREVPADSDWRLVFKIIESLEKDYRFSADRIRLVTWYIW